ncbi:MAG: hypothetical protein O7B32_02930 [Thaumarchaeota archaeon]|nr:hypothetical protein [Nitrososphaerota archaeon]MCZ6616250.1 hypothetical protein [Nitrososphaerota archaeon]MCZ6725188.1 hypothetical protein [Nitrososphaerota archaeon]
MPKEVLDIEEFRKVIPFATECRVVRSGETVKVKLRLKRLLYVYKTNTKDVDELLKEIKTDIIEI